MLAGRTGIQAGTYKSLTVDKYGRATAGANPETLAGFGIKDTYTKPEIEALIAQASALPIGAVVAFPKSAVPPGFLEVNGSVQSIATYPDLFAYLGTAFNTGGEGAGNFRLPESRGEFLRGWDHGRGIDAGRALGSYQTDTLQNITGAISAGNNTQLGSSVSGAYIGVGGAVNQPTGATVGGITSYTFDASRVARTSTETRPRNLAVMWCIKAWNAPINQGNIDVAVLAAQATENNQGTAKVATDAQMLDSANDQVIATPKKLRKGFSISLGTNGYIVLPPWLGGLVLQWGNVVVGATSAAFTFPIEFPAALYTVTGSPISSSSSSAAGGGAISVGSRTGATVYVWGTGNFTYRWFALGS